MKQFLIWIILACTLAFAGCDTTPQERITWLNNAIEQSESISSTIDVYIADLEIVLQESQAMLNNPDLTFNQRDEVVNAIAEIQRRIELAKDRKTSIMAALSTWKAQLLEIQANGATLETELDGYAEGVKIVAGNLPPPYNAIALGIAAVLPVVGGWVGKVLQRAQDKKVLKGITASVDKVLTQLPADEATAAKATLKAVQTEKGVRAQVQAVLKE